MRYFVHVKSNEAILSEDTEGFLELYAACGRAAELASEWIVKYPSGVGQGIATKLAVEIVDHDGKLIIRLPINPAYQ